MTDEFDTRSARLEKLADLAGQTIEQACLKMQRTQVLLDTISNAPEQRQTGTSRQLAQVHFLSDRKRE